MLLRGGSLDHHLECYVSNYLSEKWNLARPAAQTQVECFVNSSLLQLREGKREYRIGWLIVYTLKAGHTLSWLFSIHAYPVPRAWLAL